MAPVPFLTDFGLAKSVATGSKLTKTGETLGTPAYMSPEQARGEVSSLTPASDVWSLGCVLFEMLAGRPPFEGETAAAVVAQVLVRSPGKLRALRPEIPRAVESVLDVALSKPASGRYADGAALREELARILRGESPLALRRRRRRSGLVVAVAVVGVALPGWALVRSREPRAGAGVPSSVHPAGAGPGEALAEQARRLRTSDPTAAARLLRDALAASPARDDWRLERGLLLWASGDRDGARSEWGAVPASSAAAARAALYLGLEIFFWMEGGAADGDEALERLRFAAAAGGPEARLAAGALAEQRKDWAAARSALAGERGWEASLLRAYVEGWAPDGNLAESFREYGVALNEGIPFWWIYQNRGDVREDLGDHAGAVEDYSAALRLKPGQTITLTSRSEAWLSLGEFGKALADCDEALRQAPDDFTAIANRGIARGNLGNLAGAGEDIEAALRLRPGHPKMLSHRAVLRVKLGDREGALEDLTKALDSTPDDPEIRLRRARVRVMLGDPTGALEDCEISIRRRPEHAEAFATRGAAHAALGDLGPAEAAFRSALRLDPSFSDALVGLARVHQARGEWAEVTKLCRLFLERAPEDARVPVVQRALAEAERRGGAAGSGAGR